MHLSDINEAHIIMWRRHLHQHPELSFQEFATADYIFNILESFDAFTLTRPTATSVVATLHSNTPGQTIALRADIDALPLQEETGLSFQSIHSGVMHACGHDAHTAMLLGAAEVIASLKDQLCGTVKLIFQHAEEQLPGGARELVAAGVLQDVDYVFGLHVFPNIPTGHIGIMSGSMTAAVDSFTLKIQGKGAHGSLPQHAIDPILIGAQIINSLNHFISRSVDPFDTAVLSIGEFSSGNAANIIPDTAQIKGHIRTLTPATRQMLLAQIQTTIDHMCHMHKAQYDLHIQQGYDATINDPIATSVVQQAVTKVVPSAAIYEQQTVMGGEDFSAYTHVVPGSYFALGVGMAEDGYGYVNHHPKFQIDEAALKIGAQIHLQLICDLLLKTQ